MWSNVTEFKQWWLKSRPLRPPFDQASFITDLAYSLCLYRGGAFQIELYILKPDSTAPFHSHPGVDSTFIYLGGNLEFGLEDGTFPDLSEFQKAKENGAHMLLGKSADAPDGMLHSVRTFKEGGAFLSFEHWKEKEPDSVVLNWTGEPDGKVHAQVLGK